MADQMDENSEAAENRNLDQGAIDDALAAMQIEDTDDAAAEMKPAAHSNGGEIFAESAGDGQAELDAAIAALQDDVTEDEEAAAAEPEASGEAGQEEIDAAIAAMQADVAAGEEAAAAEPAETGEASQEDIDAAIAAMQTDVAADEEAAIAEPEASGEAGQEDIDVTVAAVQDNVSAKTHTGKTEETKSGAERTASEDKPEQGSIEEGVAEVDAVDLQAAIDSTVAEADDDDQISEVDSDPATSPDYDNAFSGLGDEDLTDNAPSRAGIETVDSAELDTALGDEGGLSRLDAAAAELAAATADGPPGAVETASEGLDDSPSAPTVESLPEISEKKSDPQTAVPVQKARRFNKKRVGIGMLCLVVLAGAAAYFGRDAFSNFTVKFTPPVEQAPIVESAPAKSAPLTIQEEVFENPYHEKLREVARLRADLLSKKDEIDRLRQFYRDGISELEEELQQEATKHGVQKLSQAIANHKIELDLQSIRRRWAYIDELSKPYHWLEQGSEELLFLSRRTEIDLQMDTIAAGIELTKHMRRMNASIQKYQLSPDRLAIDVTNTRLRPVEEIWQAISSQNKAIAQKAVANGDQEIIDEICSGDTGRIAELTTLTIKASKCLSQLDTSELFLNRLTFLSPVAAKYLSNWKGQWLCLNGFQTLPPDVARPLFQWEGRWISLNGLRDFSPQIGESLLSWEGDQLELMGLVYKADSAEKIGLQQLSDWEKAGGKLFVTESIRAEMEKLK